MEINWDLALLLSAAAYSLLLAVSVLALLWLLSHHTPLSPYAEVDRLITSRFDDVQALWAFNRQIDDARQRHRSSVMSAYANHMRAQIAAGDPREAGVYLQALQRTEAQWLADDTDAVTDDPATAASAGAQDLHADAAEQDDLSHAGASVKRLPRRGLWRQHGRRERTEA